MPTIPLSRRDVLRAGIGAGGAVLLARPAGVLAQELPSIDAYGTPRRSRLFPDQFVVHTDMHNHSLFSDGDGDPIEFYDLLRESGVDVAALTDHATVSDGLPETPCALFGPAQQDCLSVAGLTERTWDETKLLADENDAPGDFAAIAGFEWSSPTLGHMNVWFSEEFTDPLNTGGIGDVDDLLEFARVEGIPVPPEVVDGLRGLVAGTPAAGLGMAGWYDWLKADPGRAVQGGGSDGIFGFNHPGREPARFGDFSFDPDLVDRCVSMELFNKNDDYLFELVGAGRPSPLVACLDAGWRPGILGTSDYHGVDWGTPDDRGRAGMYVTELSRAAVRSAMEDRRFYATRIKGVRFDATANGVRMGRTLAHRDGDVTFRIDIDRGPAWYGKRLVVQVLGTGAQLPTILDQVEVRVPTPDEPVLELTVPISVDDTPWVVLRVTDPELPAEGNAPAGVWADAGRAVVYASPMFLDAAGEVAEPAPDGGPDAPAPAPGEPADPAPAPDQGPTLPATGGGSIAVGAAALAISGMLGFRGRRSGEHQHGHGHDHGPDGHDGHDHG